MLTILAWIGIIVAILAMGVGTLATMLGLPGSVLVLVVSCILSISTHWERPPWWMLIIFLVVTVVAELADNVLAAWGTKKYGGSTKGALWAMAGGIIGAVIGGYVSPISAIGGPALAVIGIILVPLACAMGGAYLGGYWFELRQGRTDEDAKRAGWGALMGRVSGGLLKATLSAIMTALTIWMLFRNAGPFA